MKQRESSIRGIEFNPGGQILATSSDFGFLTLYDLCQLNEQQTSVPSKTLNYSKSPLYCSTSTRSSMLFWYVLELVLRHGWKVFFYSGGENVITGWTWDTLCGDSCSNQGAPSIEMQCNTDIQCVAGNNAVSVFFFCCFSQDPTTPQYLDRLHLRWRGGRNDILLWHRNGPKDISKTWYTMQP